MDSQDKKLSFFKRPGTLMLAMAAIIAATLFLLLIDVYKTYRTDISVLVVSKTESAAEQHSEIVDTVAQMPKMLSFYDKLLSENTDIYDPSKGKSQDERKIFWNNNIDVSSKQGSILVIGVHGKSEADSKVLTKKTAKTLASFIDKWYNQKNDVEIFVIDQSSTVPFVKNWFSLAIASLLIGFVFAYLLEMLFHTIQISMQIKRRAKSALRGQIIALKNALRRDNVPKIENIEDIYSQNQEDTSHRESIKLRSEEIFKHSPNDSYPNFPEMPSRHPNIQGMAPNNLPIGDEEQFNPNSFEDTQHTQPLHKHESEDPNELQEDIEEMRDREPTEEELKRRLNQLLQGHK